MTGQSEYKQIGFIGLGAMGRPMAANLAGHLHRASSPAKIHVYDVVSAPVDELHSSFPDIIIKCTSPRDVAERSNVIFTMLPEGSHVKSVYLDPSNGIITALSPSRSPPPAPILLIDCSTIDTATHLLVKSTLSEVSQTDIRFYDAPVSGGVIGARNGTIAFFLGCTVEDDFFPHLQLLLGHMGKEIVPCGGPSLGLAAKLANNYLSGTITIACAEAMDMGMRAGIHPAVLKNVFSAGTAQNRICDDFNPVPGVCPNAPPSHGYKGGFRVQLMRKDIGLAVDMARRVGARNVLGVSTLGVYAAASEAADCKDLDSRVVFRFLGGMEDMNQRIEAEVKMEEGVE
ncbi:NAD binding domain of 6-phosphogluconate dehydrogenase-domain-containing protein [Cladorrhinum sp. PSN332]|nr:NAD binding domain of 6-phosphogluconate dehydrogenase-domain-containing protein [Cladorrhinum sp. PSN332]